MDKAALKEAIVETLRTVFDPEIPVNIYDLGLIYGIQVSDRGVVDVEMTLTSPACPVAGSLPPEVEAKVAAVDGVASARVELVWDPPWTQDKLSEAAKLQLGLL
ncbi:MAG: SUF system Fe-S cluster assembly protein [Planctomycetota bacterium]|jgi:FeS assembly SUF system protein